MNSAIFAKTVAQDAIKKRKAKGKPIVLEVDTPDGRVLEIDALDTDTQEELSRRVDDVMATYNYRNSTGDRFIPEGGPRGRQMKPIPQGAKPKAKPQPKPEPKTWAQNAAESVGKKLVETGILGKPPTAPATGKRTERDLWEFASIKLAEDRQRYEQANGPTPEADLVPYTFNVNGKPKTIKIPFWQVPELNAYKGGAIPSERERNQRRLAETVQRATDITESVKSAVTDNPITNTLGKLETGAMGVIAPGSENAYKNVVGDKGVVGHLAGMIAGALNVPVEVATEMAVITNPGVSREQALRATANILIQGGTLDTVVEQALKRGLSKRSAAIIEANSGITPPVPKTGTKAALPRDVPPMRVAEPTQMPGFTGTTRRSVLEPKVPSVLDEVLGPPAAKPAVEPMPASVLDEVLGEPTPKPDANRAKEPWQAWKEWTNSDPPAQPARTASQEEINAYIKATRDDKQAGSDAALAVLRNPDVWHNLTREEFLRAYAQVSPMQRAFDGPEVVRVHGEHVETALREGKPVPAEVLADYPDLAAKYGKTAEQNAPVKPPTSPAETPQPAAATVERTQAIERAIFSAHQKGLLTIDETRAAMNNAEMYADVLNAETPKQVAKIVKSKPPMAATPPAQTVTPRIAKVAYMEDQDGNIVRANNQPVQPELMIGVHPNPKSTIETRVLQFGSGDDAFDLHYAVTSTVGNNRIQVWVKPDGTPIQAVAEVYDGSAPAGSRWKRRSTTPFMEEWLKANNLVLGDADAWGARKVMYKSSSAVERGENSVAPTLADLQKTVDPDGEDIGFTLGDDVSNTGNAAVSGNQTVTPTAAVAESATTPTTPTSARQATGLANVVQDAEADAGMIASSPRATGTKRGEAQAKGKAAVESGQIDPETLAAEIASGKRTFKDETEVGALMEGKRRLLQQAEELGKKIDEAHARGEDATALIGQRDAIRARLNTLIENVQVGKGKWSDVGRSLQEGTTIDEGNFENVLAEFRRNKPDGKVSEREAKALQDLVDQHNATKEQLAKVESELAKLKAAEGAQVIARKGTVGRRTVTQIRAERDLVAASISKSIREAIGGPIGFGGGGLENLFEVVPQLARDLRKLIELYIEEFKVGKLDSEFYVGAKQVIRDALADVPDEVLDDLKVDLKNLSDDEVNRIFGGIYDVKQSRTKNEVQARIAELKKQAELLAKIEGAKEGEVLKAGTPPPPASPKVRELRAQLNELLKGLGADPSMDGVRTRLNNILDDLNKQSHGKYRNIKDNKTRVSPPDIQRIREQIASVRRDMRLEDTLADLEEQLATGNYKTRNKREIALTKQQIIMRDAVNEKRKIIRRKIAEASRGPFEKAMGVIDGAFSTLREGVATGDISFSGIQGSLAMLTDTKAWANGTRASLKSYGSMGYDEIVKLIKSDADFDKIARTGVDLPAITSESEELFQNSVLQRVPVLGKGVKAAQRSYDGGATMTRYMMAKSHVALAESLNGGPLSDAAMKQIGDAVNSMSGRASSKLGKAVRTADFGRGIFAPSYWISLFEAGYRPLTTAIDVGAKTGDWGPAKVYARKTARMYAGGVAVLGTTKLVLESQTEWKVEIDPRSSLFGKAYKIKNGKVASVDLLPPQLSQAIKTLSMQAFGKKDLAGDVDTSAYGRTAWIGQLIEGKAAPGPKMFLSARDSMHVTNEKGTDAKPEDYPFGKNTDPRTGEGLKNLGLGSIPLTAQSAKEMIETDALSPLEKWLLAPLVVFGRGPSVYPLGKTAKKKLGL